MKVLVINSGSSSLKYQLFELPEQKLLAKGMADRIGLETGSISLKTDRVDQKEQFHIPNHDWALNHILNLFTQSDIQVIQNFNDIEVVGHRVVHGGQQFSAPTLMTDEVIEKVKSLSFLAPLHNPANITGVEVAKTLMPDAKQVGIFDTAFHQTNPEEIWRYALPNELYEKHEIRRYGFHGTSHQYITKQVAKYYSIPVSEVNLISCHLGNGCSMAAIVKGKSFSTSMGFTPTGGLIMGTRPGDFDTGIPLFLEQVVGWSSDKVVNMINKESGMLALTGMSDLRDIEESYMNGDETCAKALNMYAQRIVEYIGNMIATMGVWPKAISFTGGVGENSSIIRKKVADKLTHLGIEIANDTNDQRMKGTVKLSTTGSKVDLLKVETNEELEIAQQSFHLVNSL